MNNYRVDVYREDIAQYKIEFPEYYLGLMFAETVAHEEDVTGVYIYEKMSDGSFRVTRRIK